jgi:hypothetical protein
VDGDGLSQATRQKREAIVWIGPEYVFEKTAFLQNNYLLM